MEFFLDFLKFVYIKLLAVHDYIFWSFTFGIVQTMFSPKRNRDILAYFFTAFICVPVGVLSGLVSQEFGFSQGTIYSIVAISALISQDLIKFILGSAGFINSHKESILNSLFTYISNRFLRIDRNKDEANN